LSGVVLSHQNDCVGSDVWKNLITVSVKKSETVDYLISSDLGSWTCRYWGKWEGWWSGQRCNTDLPVSQHYQL